MPKLEIITGEYAQHQFLVEKVGVWIGSDERCDLRLEEPGISRFHVQILRDAQGIYWLEDAGSSFGTLLNGQDVERSPLHDGDVITLGRVKLCYHSTPNTSDSSASSTSSSYTPSRPHIASPQQSSQQDWLSPATAAQSLLNTASSSSTAHTDFSVPAAFSAHVHDSLLSPHDNDDDIEEVLDGDELELIEEQDSEEDMNDWDDEGDYPIDTEGTKLVSIPLSPSAFLSNSVAPPQAVQASALSVPIVVTQRAAASVISEITPLPPESTVSASIPRVPTASVQASLASISSAPDEEAEEDMDLHGPPPPARSRTVLFNLELERLKFELQQREKQLVALQVEAEQFPSQADQQARLKQTLDMVQEDNKRLQYQISAYEEAAEENEQLLKQVEKLLQDNKRLYNDNKKLREKLQEYEHYFYQQSGSHS